MIQENSDVEDQKPPAEIDFQKDFLEAGKTGSFLTLFESNPECRMDAPRQSAQGCNSIDIVGTSANLMSLNLFGVLKHVTCLNF